MSAALVQGPMVMQTPEAAALAEVLCAAAERLWDAATEVESGPMWEEARRHASWVLAVCHRAEGELARRRCREPLGRSTAVPAPPSPSASQPLQQAALPGLEAQSLADPG